MTLADEELAAKIVKVYFREVARIGFKRSLTLDEVINAYYYTLSRLEQKEVLMKEALVKVKQEEEVLKTETKEELVPTPSTTTTTFEEK